MTLREELKEQIYKSCEFRNYDECMDIIREVGFLNEERRGLMEKLCGIALENENYSWAVRFANFAGPEFKDQFLQREIIPYKG